MGTLHFCPFLFFSQGELNLTGLIAVFAAKIVVWHMLKEVLAASSSNSFIQDLDL